MPVTIDLPDEFAQRLQAKWQDTLAHDARERLVMEAYRNDLVSTREVQELLGLVLIDRINGFMLAFGEVGAARDTALRRRDDTHPMRSTPGADTTLGLALGAVTPGSRLHHRGHGAPGDAATGSAGGSAGAGACCCCLDSGRGTSRKRRLRRSRRARPNIWRFNIFRRLIWPSTGPELQGNVTPALTAA
jgi:hypothetical protein